MLRCKTHKLDPVTCVRNAHNITPKRRRTHSLSLESNWSSVPSRGKSKSSNTSVRGSTKNTQAYDEKVGRVIKSKDIQENSTTTGVQKQKELSSSSATSTYQKTFSTTSSKLDSISITKELLEKELMMQHLFYSHSFSERHPFVKSCSDMYQKTPQVILDHIQLLSEGHCIQSMICLEGSEFTVPELLDFCENVQEAVRVEKLKQKYFQKLGTKVREHMIMSYSSVFTHLDFAVQFPSLATEDILYRRNITAQNNGLSNMETELISGLIEDNNRLLKSAVDLIGKNYSRLEEVYQGLTDVLAYRITTQSHLRSMVQSRLGDVTVLMADEKSTFAELVDQPLKYYEWKAGAKLGEPIEFVPPNFPEIKNAVYDTMFSQCVYQGPEATDIKKILDEAIDLGIKQLFKFLSGIKWKKAVSNSFLYKAMEEDLKRLLLREKFEDTVLALDSYAGYSLAIVHPTQGILYTKEFSKFTDFNDPFLLDTMADLTKQFRVKLVVVNNTGKNSSSFAPLLAHWAQKYPKLQQRQHTFNRPHPESALYKFFLPKSFSEISLPGRKQKTASYAVANAVTLAKVTIDPFEYTKYPDLLPLGYYSVLLSHQDYSRALLAIAGVLLIREGVDVNTADKNSLSFVGMSPTLANQILQYREKFKGYKSKMDLLRIPSIPSHLAKIFVPLVRIKDSENPFDQSALAPSEYRYAASILHAFADVSKNKKSDEEITAELSKQLNIPEKQVISILDRIEYSHDYQPSIETPIFEELQDNGVAPVVGSWSYKIILNFPLGHIGSSEWRYSYQTYPIGSTMPYKVKAISQSGRVHVNFPKVGQ